MRVLVAGASGFIGTELSRQLEADGHTVLRLVRRRPRGAEEFEWSPAERTIDPSSLELADAVVNLAGASTGRVPWTRSYKREILYSRVNGTRTIAEAINAAKNPPAAFLNASAVGFYGHRPGEVLTESSEKGVGFLSDVVLAWETAARLAEPTTRVVTFRTGVVVERGGAFTPLVPLTSVGLGSRLGSGQQIWPWVALVDEAAAIRHLLTSTLSGPVNIAAPATTTSGEVTHELARALNRWDPWVVPEIAIRLLGDAGSDLLLASQRVESRKLLDDGFEFRVDTVEKAMAELVSA